MTTLMSRPTSVPELFRFLESGWPFGTSGDRHPVRIEEDLDDGNYVLRAELPGMDPEKDIHVSVEGNELTIAAERMEHKSDKAHSEFSYGSFARTVRLPSGAALDKASARYEAGILEVTVPVTDQPGGRQISIKTPKTK